MFLTVMQALTKSDRNDTKAISQLLDENLFEKRQLQELEATIVALSNTLRIRASRIATRNHQIQNMRIKALESLIKR